MSESMSYATPDPYLSAHPSYYPPPPNAPIHIVPPPHRTEAAARKRPKYTRSKTGCMTCRVKKIKCDETKPNCMRCTHGSREVRPSSLMSSFHTSSTLDKKTNSVRGPKVSQFAKKLLQRETRL
ncbi:hypothetical protein BJ165DRAFT_1455237, partial [Panaeolus papilionaceus]